jgi:hypothetical protein
MVHTEAGAHGEGERVDVPVTAMLLQRGGAVGRFTVQNLSAGGAILTGAHDVRRSAPLRVVLELPSGESLSVGAHVRRRAVAGGLVALAVAFRHVNGASEDRIQDALLELLDAKNRADHPAVLVAEPEADVRADLVGRAVALGRRAIAAEAPLVALRVLDDPRENVSLVLAREGACAPLLELVAQQYEGVRSVLLVDDPSADPSAPRGVERCGPEHLPDLLA